MRVFSASENIHTKIANYNYYFVNDKVNVNELESFSDHARW